MLVLTRKEGQRIVVGENIVITVLDVRGDRIRIGVSAPPEVAVHRDEVFQRLQHEQALAALDVPDCKSYYYADSL